MPAQCDPGYWCPGSAGANMPANRFLMTNATQPCTVVNGLYGMPFSGLCGCPPGTYSGNASLASAAECTTCPASFYCSGARTAVDGPCAQGHFCPEGTGSSVAFPCPNGTFTASTDLYNASQCTDAPPGFWAAAGRSEPGVAAPTTHWRDAHTCFAARSRTALWVTHPLRPRPPVQRRPHGVRPGHVLQRHAHAGTAGVSVVSRGLLLWRQHIAAAALSAVDFFVCGGGGLLAVQPWELL